MDDNILRNKQPTDAANNFDEYDDEHLNQLPQGFSMDFETDVQTDMVMNFGDIDNIRQSQVEVGRNAVRMSAVQNQQSAAGQD